MANFLLLALDPPNGLDGLSPAEIQAIIERYVAWTEGLRASGSLVDSNKLVDGEGRVLTREGSEIVVRDGPYTETKEIVGGYWIVAAEDYDAAIRLCRDCPHLVYGTLEIRQIDAL